MAAVCIWYKEEQKGNKTGMNQDRVYENRINSYQGNPMERPEPFFAAQPLWGRSMEEQQEARERQRMQSYYSRTASDLQRLVEAECDRMDYRGKDEKAAEEELLDLIGVLFYNEMFRRRSRRKHYYNLWL